MIQEQPSVVTKITSIKQLLYFYWMFVHRCQFRTRHNNNNVTGNFEKVVEFLCCSRVSIFFSSCSYRMFTLILVHNHYFESSHITLMIVLRPLGSCRGGIVGAHLASSPPDPALELRASISTWVDTQPSSSTPSASYTVSRSSLLKGSSPSVVSRLRSLQHKGGKSCHSTPHFGAGSLQHCWCRQGQSACESVVRQPAPLPCTTGTLLRWGLPLKRLTHEWFTSPLFKTSPSRPRGS